MDVKQSAWILGLLVSPAAGQEIVPTLSVGDSFGGGATVQFLGDVSLGPNGEQVLTFHWSTAYSGLLSAQLAGGHLVAQAGDPVPGKPGEVITQLRRPVSNVAGTTLQGIQWSPAVGLSQTALLLDDQLAFEEGDAVPAAPPGTTFTSFKFGAYDVNDVGDALLHVTGSTSTGAPYSAFLRIEDVGSASPTHAIVHARGDVIPGVGSLMTIHPQGLQSAWTDDGRLLWMGVLDTDDDAILSTDTATGSVTVLAREGQPSPLPGRPWKHLQNALVDRNDAGDWAHWGIVEGPQPTNRVLIKNGQVYQQEGFGSPALPPGRVWTDFGHRVDFDAAGNLLWSGAWDDPNTSQDEGLFLNETMIVRKGVTQVDGATVTGFESALRRGLSGDGRFVATELALSDGRIGMFLIDLDPALVYCTAKANSSGCAPRIDATGIASAASTLPFDIVCTNALNQKPGTLFFGFGATSVPFLGGTLCVQPPLARTAIFFSGGNPPPADCSGSYTIDFQAVIQTSPISGLAAGAVVCAQWWMRDPQNGAGVLGTALSDAIQTTIAP